MRLWLSLFCLALAGAPPARAAMIPITDETEIRLGDGVEPITEQGFNACVEFDPADMYSENDGKGSFSARKAELSLELITSYLDYDRYTNVQISGSVKTLAGGGGFSYGAESKYTLHSDQAALGISSHADYGRWYLRSAKLRPEMAALAKKDPRKFKEVCGTEYVAGYVLGQGIRVLLTTAQNSVYSYEKIQASLNASYNGGAYSGKMDAAFMNVTSELIKNGMLKIHFLSYGAGTMSASESLIRDQTDIAGFRAKIADLVSKTEGQQAVPITYLTRPYPGVDVEYNPVLADHKKQTISLLFASYRRLADTRLRLGSLMGPQFDQFAEKECVKDYRTYCQDYVQAMKKTQKQIEESIKTIEEMAKTCIKAEKVADCPAPDPELINLDVLNRVRWPNQFKYAMYVQMLKDIRDRRDDDPAKP